jgi:quercetin dioxygenase-like cupin family protein
MAGLVQRAGEGEALFGGRIVIKAGFEQLSITESWFDSARPGAGPHIHRQHADSFYVLEGELAFLVQDEERQLGPGACVCAPAGVVHGFRSTSPARFLNLHTPDGGFANNLRARDRGEPGGFDSFDAPVGSGLSGSNAILLQAGQGEQLEADNRIATIKIGLEQLSLVEFELEPGFEGPEPHRHDDHVDSFYVLEGEAEFFVGNDKLLVGAGSFVAAPPGVVHTFSSGPGPSRLLNIHAPSSGFHEWLRENSKPSREARALDEEPADELPA